jgi:hypothetical protein
VCGRCVYEAREEAAQQAVYNIQRQSLDLSRRKETFLQIFELQNIQQFN